MYGKTVFWLHAFLYRYSKVVYCDSARVPAGSAGTPWFSAFQTIARLKKRISEQLLAASQGKVACLKIRRITKEIAHCSGQKQPHLQQI